MISFFLVPDEDEDEESKYDTTWVVVYLLSGVLYLNNFFLILDNIPAFIEAVTLCFKSKDWKLNRQREIRHAQETEDIQNTSLFFSR